MGFYIRNILGNTNFDYLISILKYGYIRNFLYFLIIFGSLENSNWLFWIEFDGIKRFYIGKIPN